MISAKKELSNYKIIYFIRTYFSEFVQMNKFLNLKYRRQPNLSECVVFWSNRMDHLRLEVMFIPSYPFPSVFLKLHPIISKRNTYSLEVNVIIVNFLVTLFCGFYELALKSVSFKCSLSFCILTLMLAFIY